MSQSNPDPFSTKAVDRAAEAWWNALHAATGVGVTWDQANNEAKDTTREYIRSTE